MIDKRGVTESDRTLLWVKQQEAFVGLQFEEEKSAGHLLQLLLDETDSPRDLTDSYESPLSSCKYLLKHCQTYVLFQFAPFPL